MNKRSNIILLSIELLENEKISVVRSHNRIGKIMTAYGLFALGYPFLFPDLAFNMTGVSICGGVFLLCGSVAAYEFYKAYKIENYYDDLIFNYLKENNLEGYQYKKK